MGKVRGIVKHTLLLLLFCPWMIFALPSGGEVAHGVANIAETAANTIITQGSDKAIINWQDFSIKANESVRFIQPSNQSSMLNRVIGGDISKIYGSLSSNGKIFLINPNGIIIGPSGTINVGCFIASALPLSNEHFIKGSYYFEHSDGKIVNEGKIYADKGIYIFAKAIENKGDIVAKEDVVLSALSEVYFMEEGEEHAFVKTKTEGFLDNEGLIKAAHVELKAVSDNIYGLAIKQAGVIDATSAIEKDGRLILAADSGNISITNKLLSKDGGTIHIYGGDIAIKGAVIDVSSEHNGGEVYIGTDLTGTVKATTTFINEDVFIHASSLKEGNGGKVIIWSDNGSTFLGNIDAQGGDVSGNGGFVEISSHSNLIPKGHVNTSAPHGNSGTLLLDPDYDITISHNASENVNYSGWIYSPIGIGANIMTGDLVVYLDVNDVTVTTSGTGGSGDGTITVNNDIAWDSVHKLTLQAAKSIVINANITMSAAATLDLQANIGGIYTNGSVGITLGNVLINALHSNAIISLNGHGGGTAASPAVTDNNYGIYLAIGSTISAGSIIFNGTGGYSTQATDNHGIYMDNAQIIVYDTAITNSVLTGTSGNGTSHGIYCNNSSIVVNNDGKCTMTGNQSTTNNGCGIIFSNSHIQSTTAVLELTGHGGVTADSHNNHGIYFTLASYATSTVGSISLLGYTDVDTGFGNGVLLNSSYVSSTSGAIAITGDAMTTHGTEGDGIHAVDSNILSATGDITLIGKGGTVFDYNSGISFYNSYIKSTGASGGKIELTGTVVDGQHYSYGIFFEHDSYIDTNVGNITCTGSCPDNSDGCGIFFDNGSNVTTATGAIALTGTAGEGTIGGFNNGIMFTGAYIQSTSDSSGGNVVLHGTTKGSGNFANGIEFFSSYIDTKIGAITLEGVNSTGHGLGVVFTAEASLTSTKGAIELTGTGGSVSDYNHGISVTDMAYIASTDTATIKLTGTKGTAGTNSRGIFLTSDNPIRSTGTGYVKLITDSIVITGTISGGTTANDHTCYIYPKTLNTTVGIGTTAAGTLNIDNTTITSIGNTWKYLELGDTTNTSTVNISTGAGCSFYPQTTTIKNKSSADMYVTRAISWDQKTKIILSSLGYLQIDANITNTATHTAAFDALELIGNGATWGLTIDGHTISTVDGNIAITGTSAGYDGLLIRNPYNIIRSTGKGSINLTGYGTADWMGIGIYVDPTTKIQTNTGNISLYGQSSTGGNGVTGIIASYLTIQSTSGNIVCEGESRSSNIPNPGCGWGIRITGSSSISTSGNITLTGTDTGTSSTDTTAAVNIDGSCNIASTNGKITISGTCNNSDNTYAHYGVQLGGSVSILANNNAQIEISGLSGTGTHGNNYGIYTSGTQNISSKNGNIVINGQSRGTAGTANHGIYCNTNIESTGTANIQLTGVAGIGTGNCIYLYGGYVKSSSSGTITLSADASTKATNGYGIFVDSAYIQSTTGDINLTGTGGIVSNNNHGIYFDNSSYVLSNNAKITLIGTAKGSGSVSHGIYFTSSNVQATGTGQIIFSGSASTASGNGILCENNSNIQTTNGSISLTGIGGSSGNNNHGICFTNSSKIRSSGSADIAINGTAGGTGTVSHGIYFDEVSYVQSDVTGNIDITGSAFNANGYGILFDNNAAINGQEGTLSLDGTGGNVGDNDHGICFFSSYLLTNNGKITLIGTAGGTGTLSNGIYFDAEGYAQSSGTGEIDFTGSASTANGCGISLVNSSFISATANISLIGTGGSVDNNNRGISMISDSYVKSNSNTATITLTGTQGAGSSLGIYLVSAGYSILSQGNVELIANTMSIAGGINGDSEYLPTCSIHPKDAATSMGLGTGASGTLNLDDTALGKIDSNWSTVIFGNNSTATTTVNTATTLVDDIIIYGKAINITSALSDPNKTIIFYVGPISSGTFTIGAAVTADDKTVNGGNFNNTFNLNAGSVNTINGGDGTNIYNIHGGDVSIAINGGDSSDHFIFYPGGAITGSINGVSGGTNWLDYSTIPYGAAINVVMTGIQAGSVTGIVGSFSNINKISGDSSKNNSITCPDMDNHWNITGVNVGDIDDLSFEDIQNIIGGSLDDYFAIGVSGSLSGTIQGVGSINVLDYSAWTNDVTVNLSAGTATNITGGVTGIQGIIAGKGKNSLTASNTDDNFFEFLIPPTGVSTVTGNNSFSDTLIIDSGNNTWNITGVNGGDVGNITFTQISNLNGGSDTDRFVFAPSSSLAGTITGGIGGSAILDYSSYDAATNVVLTSFNNGSATAIDSFINIKQIDGSSGNENNKITGDDSGLMWMIYNTNEGTVGNLIFKDFPNLVGGAGNDIFVLYGGTVTGYIDGGGGDNVLYADDFDANIWHITSMNSGTLNDMPFSNIQSLIGGNLSDYFLIYNNAGLANLLDGGNGSGNVLDYSLWTTMVRVDLPQHFATNIGYVTNIQIVILPHFVIYNLKVAYDLLWLSYPHSFYYLDGELIQKPQKIIVKHKKINKSVPHVDRPMYTPPRIEPNNRFKKQLPLTIPSIKKT
jgi:filamentous hemagglutinin family protein